MASNFDKAFAAARKSGKKTFTFGGKSYNTKLADSKPKAKPAKTPTKAPTPTSRSSAVSGMSKSRPSYSGMSDVAKNSKSTTSSAAAKNKDSKAAVEKMKSGMKSNPKTVYGGKPLIDRGLYKRK